MLWWVVDGSEVAPPGRSGLKAGSDRVQGMTRDVIAFAFEGGG